MCLQAQIMHNLHLKIEGQNQMHVHELKNLLNNIHSDLHNLLR